MKYTLLSFLLFGYMTAVAQQDTVQSGAIGKIRQRFEKGRLGFPFPPLGKWETLDDRNFDFNSFLKPAMVYVGTIGCAPCAVEVPVMLDYAAAHPEADFIYLTSSDSALIFRQYPDFRDETLPANFFAVQVPNNYLHGYKLQTGSPTKWVVAIGGKAQHIFLGGNTNKSKSLFLKELDSVTEEKEAGN